MLAELSEKLGTSVGMDEIGQSKWLATTFDSTTSIIRARRRAIHHSKAARPDGWLASALASAADRTASKYDDAATKFVENYILGTSVNGRVHAEIHPHLVGWQRHALVAVLVFRSAAATDARLTTRSSAPLIRGCFLPDEGEVWAKPDISQQEFRFIVHYAVLHQLSRAKEAAELYRTDPEHRLPRHGLGLDRHRSAVGEDRELCQDRSAPACEKFAEMIGKPLGEAQAIYAQYDRELPFVAQLLHASARATPSGRAT